MSKAKVVECAGHPRQGHVPACPREVPSGEAVKVDLPPFEEGSQLSKLCAATFVDWRPE